MSFSATGALPRFLSTTFSLSQYFSLGSVLLRLIYACVAWGFGEEKDSGVGFLSNQIEERGEERRERKKI